MLKMKRLSALALVATAAIVLSGCSPATDDQADAQEPTSDSAFTLYSGRNEKLVQPLIDIFEKQSGIEVDVRYGDTAELSALLLEEGDKTPADVFLSQDAGALGALAEAGLFTELSADTTELVAPGFTSTDDTWVGVTGRARVVAYDSEALAADEVPEQVEAFAQPEWSGRFGIAPGNASFQAFVTAYRQLEGDDAAGEWVSGVAENDPELFESNDAILRAVDEGVVETGLINHYYWFRMAAEVGAENMRAQLVFPETGDPGSIVNVTGAGLLKPAAADADAQQFIDFLLSSEAQQYFVDETFEYPLVEGVEAPEGLPELQSLVNPELDLADLKSLSTTQRLLQQHGLI